MDQVQKRAYRHALKVVSPSLAGIAAWGAVSGMAMVKSGLTLWHALGMSIFVYAGSAQLVVLPLIAAQVPILVIFLTATIVNLRFLIFGAAIGPHFAHLPWHLRLWNGYLNSDLAMGYFPQRYPLGGAHPVPEKLAFFSGISHASWIAWQGGSIVGIFLSGYIPTSWGIGFAGTLALLTVMVPMTINTSALVGVIVSGTVAVLAFGLPYRLGLLLAVILGMIAAVMADSWSEKRQTERLSGIAPSLNTDISANREDRS
ncbi:branched-chain amino acid transporter AzlC [Glaciimonas sp. PCH181]|nr:branched-chain amino acid transporter AzlC [Glaciimonas sp. PCH181]